MAPIVTIPVTTPERVGWQGIESAAPYVVIGMGNGGYPFLRCFRELVPDGLAGRHELTYLDSQPKLKVGITILH